MNAEDIAKLRTPDAYLEARIVSLCAAAKQHYATGRGCEGEARLLAERDANEEAARQAEALAATIRSEGIRASVSAEGIRALYDARDKAWVERNSGSDRVSRLIYGKDEE